MGERSGGRKEGLLMAPHLSSPLPWDENARELTGTTLNTLALAALLVAWVWLFVAASLAPNATRTPAELRTVVPPALLLASSALCLLAKWRLAGRSLLLLAGLSGTFLLSYLWLNSPVWLYCLTLVVIIAGLLIGSRVSFAVALLLTLACLLPDGSGLSKGQALGRLPAVALLWAGAFTSWLSARSLYITLQWALHSQQQASQLLEALRERQGELNRTVTALTEASRRLERTNQELGVARQRAEEARAAKEHFVANVSHELRTPLNLIVGFSELLYLEPESYEGVSWTPDLQSDVGELYRASQHLQSLVNDILDLSRIDAARLPMYREMADVGAVISEAVGTMVPLLRQRGLSWALELPEAVPQVLVDRTRIRQVLLNLLNNAVRYTDRGEIRVSLRQTDEALEVVVRDTGAGIPADKLASVFEEFQQIDDGPRRRGGVGLGLAVSRQFIELHGGRMWAESEVGVGSAFHFTLPLPGALPQTAPLLHVAAQQPAGATDAPVVVVDPDPGIAGMLSRYLGNRRLLAAKDAAEAEALIEAVHPAAVIVNQVPDAPSKAWLGALGKASERYSVPTFRCSIPSPSWLRRSRGLDDCLTKPVSRETLQEAVRKCCATPAKVLVIDDSVGFANLMGRLLSTSGVAREVLTAHSGEDGIRLAREARPDLVLLDLLLPDRHGFSVLEALRAEPALQSTAVVAVTATSYAEETLLQRGGQFTLTRSGHISAGQLTELLQAALDIVHPDYVSADDRAASSA